MKKEIVFPFLPPILYIILGVFTFLTADTALPALCCVAGGMLIAVGAILMIRYLCRPATENFSSNGFVSGFILLALGITLIAAREIVIGFIPFALGFVIAINGIRELQNAIDVWKLGIHKPGIVFAVSLLNVILGVVFMIRPGLFGAMLMNALGIGLAVSGLADLITTAVVLGKTKQMEQSERATEKKEEGLPEITAEAVSDTVPPKETAAAEIIELVSNTPSAEGDNEEKN